MNITVNVKMQEMRARLEEMRDLKANTVEEERTGVKSKISQM